jgi:hypothetical protein
MTLVHSTTLQPTEEGKKGFEKFENRYVKGISIEKNAVEALK